MATPSGKVQRFTHVYLSNWRNFARVNIDLQRRAFLVGPNASGKSNFLDVFRFLRDVAAPVGGGFQDAVSKHGGVSSLRFLGSRRPASIAIKVALGNDNFDSVWEYELTFTQDNRQRPFIQTEKVIHLGKVILERPNEEDEKDSARLSQTYLEQVNVNQHFREIAEFLASSRYLHVVPQLVREPDRSAGKHNDPYGGDFLEQLANTHYKTTKSRLERIVAALKVAIPQFEQLELRRDERGVPHLYARFSNWRNNIWINEDQLSDGTLRLLGILWSVQDGRGPLLLEEPELSLHAEIVRYIPQMLARVQHQSGRQVLVSTHSSDLLRDEGIGLDEVLLLLPSDTGTQMVSVDRISDAKPLLNNGLDLADVVVPHTSPASTQQMALFWE
ncbi:MAG: chromosome segregation protein SMC [Candidatus Chloroheliales bacterium]|nr:MAG: chromosome segregation protein SMC [Chloroflexota bacterium]